MTKNPFLNALAALIYIVLVASFMFYGTRQLGHENSVLIPIAMLSLFTHSAAVMGYIFFAQPVQLYLDGKKKAAVDLFIKTLAVFSGFTLLALIVLFSRIFH